MTTSIECQRASCLRFGVELSCTFNSLSVRQQVCRFPGKKILSGKCPTVPWLARTVPKEPGRESAKAGLRAHLSGGFLRTPFWKSGRAEFRMVLNPKRGQPITICHDMKLHGQELLLSAIAVAAMSMHYRNDLHQTPGFMSEIFSRLEVA